MKKAVVLNILLIVLAGLAGAYFECERLVDSGKWSLEFLRIPLWNDIWILPNSDSYHLMFGIFATLLMIIKERNIFFSFTPLFWNVIAHVVVYWYLFFWIRNIGMHCLFTHDDRWWYWFPPIINDLIKLIIGA